MAVQNIVATARLTGSVCFDTIEEHYIGFTNRCDKFRSLSMKDSGATIFQIFKNGKVLVIGGKSEEEAKNIFLHYFSCLIDLGQQITWSDYKIQNIVASYNLGTPLDLYHFAKENQLDYTPELFPAVCYRNKAEKVTVNIFHTGKCMILGAKEIKDIQTTVVKVVALFENAKRNGRS